MLFRRRLWEIIRRVIRVKPVKGVHCPGDENEKKGEGQGLIFLL